MPEPTYQKGKLYRISQHIVRDFGLWTTKLVPLMGLGGLHRDLLCDAPVEGAILFYLDDVIENGEVKFHHVIYKDMVGLIFAHKTVLTPLEEEEG